jgi:hypothetical protein
VLELRGLDPVRYARRLEPAFATAAAAAPTEPGDWAAESLSVRADVYRFDAARGGSPVELAPDYVSTAQRLAERRVAQAAARLAATLNGVFCGAAAR